MLLVWKELLNAAVFVLVFYHFVSYVVGFGSEIMSCNKINKPLVVYKFSVNVMMSITMLRT